MATPHNLSLFPLPLCRLLLLLLPLVTHARPPGLRQRTSVDPSFGPLTAIMITILVGVFFFICAVFLYIYKRRGITIGNGGTWAITIGSRSTAIDARELDPTVIKSFPTMVYSDVKGLKKGNAALECAVCLCEFEEQDTLTMLPKCSHAFHQECIGLWLTSHHTCPVCRSDLRDLVPAEQGTSTGGRGRGEAEREDQVVISVDKEEKQDLGADPGRMAIVRERVTRSSSATMGGSRRMKASKVWDEGERERFTLRLPDNFKNELMQSRSSLRRSATVRALRVNGGEESGRMGYREGRSFTRGPSVWAVKSDRWASLPLSSFKASDLGPLDRLSGGGSSGRGNSGDGEDQKPSVALTKH